MEIAMTLDQLRHPRLRAWIEEVAALTTPDTIEICDGSTAEYDRMIHRLIDGGLAIHSANGRTATLSIGPL